MALNDFHDVYARYAGDVHRFATYLCGDAVLAEDITSETFLRAWTSSSPIRESTLKAYLFAIARHLYFAEWRHHRRSDELRDIWPSPEPNPEERAGQHASLERVLRGVRSLPAVDRTALLLRVQDGLSYEDIAAALNLSVANAKVKVHRARMKLATLA